MKAVTLGNIWSADGIGGQYDTKLPRDISSVLDMGQSWMRLMILLLVFFYMIE